MCNKSHSYVDKTNDACNDDETVVRSNNNDNTDAATSTTEAMTLCVMLRMLGKWLSEPLLVQSVPRPALLRQDWIKKGESPKTMNWETDRLTSGHFEKTWGTNIRPSGRMDRRYPRLKSFADLSSFFVTHACTCIHLQQHRTSRRGIVDMLFRWANALYRCCWARWVHGKQPSQMSTTLVLAQLL